MAGLRLVFARRGPGGRNCARRMGASFQAMRPLSAVEIADTPAERAQGLMNRTSLPSLAGMLFIYQSPDASARFWMKNTLIPLDMVFADPARAG